MQQVPKSGNSDHPFLAARIFLLCMGVISVHWADLVTESLWYQSSLQLSCTCSQGRAKDNNITNEVHNFYQETPTSRSMRPFLGSLTGGPSPLFAFCIHDSSS